MHSLRLLLPESGISISLNSTHPANALYSSSVTVSGIETVVSFWLQANALSPIFAIPSPHVISVKSQLENALFATYASLFPIVTCSREAQYVNAPSPILSTESGISICFRLQQPSKALLSITSSFFPNVKLLKDRQQQNAPRSICVTLSGICISSNKCASFDFFQLTALCKSYFLQIRT